MAESLQFTSYGHHLEGTTPIVMIHGWGLNSAVWQPFIEQLTDDFYEKFHIVTIDLPGFGLNVEHTLVEYTLANLAQEILQSINKPAIYLGWSLGGLVASEIALKSKEKVLGLITVASTPYFIEETDEASNKLVWSGIKPLVLKAFHQQLQKDIKTTISGFLKIQAMGSPHIRQDIKQISQLVMQYPMPNKNTLDLSLNLLETSDLRGSLDKITQPFLRLYGKADSLVPKAVIEKVTHLSQNSDVHVFAKASHAPFISNLTDFNEVLSQWLNTHFPT